MLLSSLGSDSAGTAGRTVAFRTEIDEANAGSLASGLGPTYCAQSTIRE
jgi:hypothetical protein